MRIVLQRGRWWRREIWTRDGMWRRLDGGTFCFGFALPLPRQSPERPRHRPTMTETRPLSNKDHNHEDHKLIIVNATQWMHFVEELNDDDFWWKWGCKIGLNPYLFFSNKSVYASTRKWELSLSRVFICLPDSNKSWYAKINDTVTQKTHKIFFSEKGNEKTTNKT